MGVWPNRRQVLLRRTFDIRIEMNTALLMRSGLRSSIFFSIKRSCCLPLLICCLISMSDFGILATIFATALRSLIGVYLCTVIRSHCCCRWLSGWELARRSFSTAPFVFAAFFWGLNLRNRRPRSRSWTRRPRRPRCRRGLLSLPSTTDHSSSLDWTQIAWGCKGNIRSPCL